jgi:flagellar motor switch protein FliM
MATATPTRTTSSSRRTRPRGEPVPFDFRRPTTLSREHVRAMQIVQETLARGFTTTLASTLRAVTHVAVRSIEQRPYDEYIREIPNPAMLTLLSLRPLAGLAMLQIPLRVGYVATELMLGGIGGANQPRRGMTDLELSLMRTIVELTLPEIRYAFESVVTIEPEITAQESNPQFAQLAAPTDMVIVVSFDVRIESTEEVMTLCIPFASLQPYLEALSASSGSGSQSPEKLAMGQTRLRDHVAATEVEARARFRPVVASSKQIVDLAPGDVLLFNHPVSAPLVLQTGRVPTYDVTIGRVNRHLALQIVGRVPADRHERRSRLQVVRAERPGD